MEPVKSQPTCLDITWTPLHSFIMESDTGLIYRTEGCLAGKLTPLFTPGIKM